MKDELQVLLVHPGGPFFSKRDEGAWSVPKGEIAESEDPLTRACVEFEEELGLAPSGDWIELGSVKQKGGKLVHVWALAGDLPADFKLKSNTFQLEWPPRSGKRQTFPEVDKVEFFSIEEARRKMNFAQTVFLDRLCAALQIDSQETAIFKSPK